MLSEREKHRLEPFSMKKEKSNTRVARILYKTGTFFCFSALKKLYEVRTLKFFNF